MKRREFISYAGAAAVLPVVPLSASAAPMAAAPVPASQVGWAALLARVNNTASPALLQKWMGVGPARAEALMGELFSRNIVQTSGIGAATSVQPMFPNGAIPKATQTIGSVTRKAREVVKTALDQIEDDAPEMTEVIHQEPDHEAS